MPTQPKSHASTFVLALVAALPSCTTSPLLQLDPIALRHRCASDLTAVQVYRDGLRAVLTFVESQPEVFPPSHPKSPRMLKRDQRELIRTTWRQLLDYQLALDSIEQFHKHYYLLRHQPQKNHSFLIRYSAFLAGYRHALGFIERAGRDPAVATILNEPVPELGLERGTYNQYKFRFLNLMCATEFAAFSFVHKLRDKHAVAKTSAGIAQDSAYIWNASKWKAPKMTLSNGLAILKRAGSNAWFPVQAGVSEWMGDTKVYRPNRSLISEEQIREFASKLEPGDVMMTRREWYLSNIGLPGYWPHAALYIGTSEERRTYFHDTHGADGIEEILREQSPESFRLSHLRQKDGHMPRVIEAISEGVSLTTIEHSAAADLLVVLRPRLSKREKAEAILRAFHYRGRPYDFNFDFLTDRELVCTELIYKCYEPSEGMTGLTLPTTTILGRRVTPANLITRQFDETFDAADRPFDFVLFLDGKERQDRAVEAGVDAFRKSWRRPKWYILFRSD